MLYISAAAAAAAAAAPAAPAIDIALHCEKDLAGCTQDASVGTWPLHISVYDKNLLSKI